MNFLAAVNSKSNYMREKLSAMQSHIQKLCVLHMVKKLLKLCCSLQKTVKNIWMVTCVLVLLMLLAKKTLKKSKSLAESMGIPLRVRVYS